MTLLGIAAIIAAVGYAFLKAEEAIATMGQEDREQELHDLRMEREAAHEVSR